MTLILGNSLEKLKDLNNETVDLVYLDPPYFTQKTHSLKTRDNSKQYEFEDVWESLQEYLGFIKVCLLECKRVLKETGSVFLHCDKNAAHYLRVILDEVFGFDNFQSEIIWAYRRWSNSKKGLLNSHQTIYFYSKTPNFSFNTLYSDYSPTTNVDQILQERSRSTNGKAEYRRDVAGNIVMGKEKKGVPLSDVWNIPYLNPKANERVGYPTQKPILLLEQIIKIATNENDLVLDPFCGSGTSLVAAKLLNRQFIGIDISSEAIKLSEERLNQGIRTKSFLLEKGEADYIEKTEKELGILKAIGAVPVQRNSGIDGFRWTEQAERPISIRIQKPGESLSQAKSKLKIASKTKNCLAMVLVRTNNIETASLFESFEQIESEENLLIIDAYDLLIDNWTTRPVLGVL